MAQAITSILATTAEKMSPNIPAVLEKTDTTAYGLLVKGAGKHRITKTTNGRDFRLPFKDEMVGTFGALSLAGGAFISGKGSNYNQMVQTYFPVQLGMSLNLDTIYASEDKNLAAVNSFKDTMKDAPASFRFYQDVAAHSIESGSQGLVAECATVASGTGGYTCTMDPEYGANLLTKGMRVEIFSSDLGTHRTTGIAADSLPYLTVVDKEAGTAFVHLNGASITMQNGDFLAFPGVGATPAFINGFRYFQTTNTSGTILGVSLASNPELRPSLVNANGGLVPQHGLLLHSRIKQRRGKMTAGVTGLIPMAQAAAVYSLGVAISEWQRGKNDEMIDIMPKIGDYVKWCGVNYFVDIHQSKTRLEVIDKSQWVRVHLDKGGEPDFYKQPGDGRMFFEGRNSSGSRLATLEFSMISTENIACADPGSGGVIYGCTVPTDF